ncbi:type I polyketide synthase [Actinosynnema mirum]|uniref:Erythronolide synthase n=1 Tax=Actinosynnema mirum (strain ATCC 29888 / DSM 43827 / JCM 3225 / NBRC 14064 / NCIMB 13271 / NRRL B-12336 / IMRU 3971 / 101) TaxID=446462 RepID=C6WL78_ACTMD|nr:type I polyketide synthase [Actinosynnema mirum]ACU36431.1 Erythronolide synthase [Actinosynnema mirum DSM 43827]
MRVVRSELVIALNPVHRSAPRLTAAAARAGALAVLELPADVDGAVRALADTARWTPGRFGVRVRPDSVVPALPEAAEVVLLADPARSPAEFADREVLVEVTDLAEARAALAAGAVGLVARGRESGGRVGELSTFVLLQQLLAEVRDVPVWAAGGIGPHTAAAAVAGGAAGVLLDTQLALYDDAGLPVATTEALRGLDGSETAVHQGVHFLHRRGPGATALPEDPAALLHHDPARGLLPVGQDVALATAFPRRWPTVAAAVRGVRDAITGAFADDAARTALLGDQSALRTAGEARAENPQGAGTASTATTPPGDRPDARSSAEPPALQRESALGTALPVVQGPMTRVSDSPAFAAAVADAGGLPFVALALSGADQTRALLERTRAQLGGKPWGVGILGFAAEDVRAAQLAVVEEVRPSHAIIAGGRPAQAAALEAKGVSTFLHVPSPGLLRQFLAAGARKFVFEGAECGGHVGPRNSFPLWESQVDVLLEHGAGAGTAVLFAGGVHDARSAAMVAALAAPLVRAGVEVGVLMGTAYLFTAEAVDAGAIGEVFQRHVVTATRTDLLQTAPGHATRCVASGFTGDFAALRADLARDGVPDREAWERLERFNVGRLRVASKGVERVGDELRDVDHDRQAAEGMFMAGEVSVLRSATTTIAALHADVTAGSAAHLAERGESVRAATARRTAPEPKPLRVAVVGMACMFPGAPDLPSFWANVLAGRDSVTEVPPERWDPELYYDPDGDGERTPSKWGGFLPPIGFDPLAYGIPPASLGAVEPVQLLALEASRRALVDAGYPHASTDHSRTSVVFGAESGSDLSGATTLRTTLPAYLGSVPPALDAQLPKLTEDSFPGVLANVIAGRVANRLDLGGANYTVDAACASSLTAVDVACKELVTGSSDLVLCGGADLHNGINDFLMFASVHALSPSGRSATFDHAADGIALGEGVACVVLKRLEDAERDGDRVYAVVDGVGSASDGRALGLTAPRPEGQRAALTRAYRAAGISPAQVGLVEAHGTGTVVGDRTELRTLTEVFTEAGARPGSCAVGSVKSQIGHTKCAAGLAGLIKTALALHHGVTPPTLHLTRPNPAWDRDTSPFAFHSAARPWAADPADRVAGVSAFGFGGTNFHVVLRAHDQPPARHALQEWPVELFLLRGNDSGAAIVERADRHPGARLRDLARFAAARADVAAGRGEPVRTAILAGSVAELRAKIAGTDAEGVFTADAAEPGKLAFLFPGQGSQKPGMLAELLVAFPELHDHLRLGARWADAMYPPTAFDEETAALQRERVTDTATAQPALGVVELAATELLATFGVRPDLVAGHSYGELAALAAAGVFTPADLLTASAARAEAILDQVRSGDPGTMVAVTAPADVVERLVDGLPVVAANRNSPKQTVLSGPTAAIREAEERLRAAKLGTKAIPVACAFHSPLVAGAGEGFRRVLDTMPLRAPEIPVWANRTAAPYPADADAVRAELAAQIGAPVRFAEQLEAMHDAGARVFVEVGPGRVLRGLVRAVLGDRPHRVVTLDGGLTGFLTALAVLAVSGADVLAGPLVRGRDAVDPADAPPVPGWTVDGHLVRRADGSIQPGALRPAHRVTAELIVPEQQAQQQTGTPDALVAEFLRTSREMISAQRDVLLTYLGAAGVPAPVVLHQVAQPVTAAAVARPVVEQAVVAQAAVAVVRSAPVVDVLRAVVEVVAERTGYPVEMVEPDLDLEADLSVDSIKRVEIAGELAQKLGLALDADSGLDDLAAARTAGALADALRTRLPDAAPVAPVAVAAVVASGPDVLRTIVEVVAERTGYPVEMVEPELDLEADLSVDSIKRAEIAGEVATRLGLDVGDGSRVEELSAARTAAAIAALITGAASAAIPGAATTSATPAAALTAVTAAGAPAPSTGAPAAASTGVLSAARGGAPAAAPTPAEATVIAPKRLVFREVPLPLPATTDLTGARVHLVGVEQLTGADREIPARLAALGATLTSTPAGAVVVHLGALDPAEPPLPEEFPRFQAILTAGPTALLAVDRRGEGSVTGLRGFFRTLAREYPDLPCALLESADPVAAIAAEITTPSGHPVVLHGGNSRHALELAFEDLGPVASSGAGPAGDGTAEALAAGLDRDAVVLLVGGARGITARFAKTLAAASRCRLELVGRTPLPSGPEDPDLAAATDRTALRGAFLSRGMTSPAEVERAVSAALAAREVRATLAELTGLGSEARYHAVDVLDAEALRTTVKRVHDEHGRLDAVVHAAGVIEDKLVADKSVESFRRVFGTKVDGARTLLDAVDTLPEPPRHAVLFGSIAAALGNRGQCDYAAANDALEELARRWSKPGRRGLTVHWGPWAAAGGGMVTPELMRSYAARGIALIDPDEGPLSLLRELAYGADDRHAVVYTASGW